MVKNYLQQQAEKIPNVIRETLLRKGIIDSAVNTMEEDSLMKFLFDIYEEFLDHNGEHNDWNCPKCRAFILGEFKRMKTYIAEITKI